jgi:UDPglucose 6-dehydrogenase
MIKYASNAFLATKISFVNEIAAICERTGAVVDDVARGVGLDGRIGSKFLHAGIGYGGSCLPKDVSSLIHLSREAGYEPSIIAAVHRLNEGLPDRAMEKLKEALGELKGKTVGLLGLSFKPNTDDLREAPALKIADRLRADGALIKAYDPIAMDSFNREIQAGISFGKNAYDCAEDCDAVMLVTEWNEFRELDFKRLLGLMNGDVFIDCRNVYRPGHVEAAGLKYYSFGRGN